MSFLVNPVLLTSIGILIFIGGMFYFYYRMKYKNFFKQSLNKVFLLVQLPRTESQSDREKDKMSGATGDDFKQKIAFMEQVLAGIHSTATEQIEEFFLEEESFSLEISSEYNNPEEGVQTSFYVVCSKDIVELVERQITAFYPEAYVEQVEDYNIFCENAKVAVSQLYFSEKNHYPLKDYQQFEIDPMNSIINSMSGLKINEGVAVQFLLRPKSSRWGDKGMRQSEQMFQGKTKTSFGNIIGGFFRMIFFGLHSKGNMLTGEDESRKLTQGQEDLIKKMEEKATKLAFDSNIRIVSSAPTQVQADKLLENVLAPFNQYSIRGFNTLTRHKRRVKLDFYKKWIIRNYVFRFFDWKIFKYNMVLSIGELASMFHFPNSVFNPLQSINWLKFKSAPAPPILPTEGLLLGYNGYRGLQREIRVATKDRFRHLYIIGQTGMGKSVLQKTLIKQDLAAGHGICVVDPHGDLVDDCLQWVPKERAKDVIIFDPADTSRPMGLNLLEAKSPEERDFIALDAMNMMIGLFGNEVFGPRIQDYFRNGCLTLMEDMDEGGAITDMVRLFSDDAFQKYKVAKVTNPIVRSFWENQMAKTSEKEKGDMMPYFAAKFGAFVTNTTMRNIVGQTKSAFDFSECMDTKKIVFAKLAKGLIGDINANLLGMIFVNKIQVAAMGRAAMASEDRIPFFLYVDEFQNFVTDAFESILSEARKYKLGLIIAHQYINQLIKDNNEKVKNAVFGNVGTMLNFKIGAQDAEYMEKEMAPVFSQSDLIALEGFQTTMKLNVNNIISRPFSMNTIKDFEAGDMKLAETITQISRLKYGRDKEFVNREILARIGATM